MTPTDALNMPWAGPFAPPALPTRIEARGAAHSTQMRWLTKQAGPLFL
jgi:hypothetical protein